MRKTISIILFFLMNISISANDGRVVIGPSIEIIDNEDTNVIMKSEVINIVIKDEYYEVTVDFEFYNEGDDETILIGFPVESWGFVNYENIFDNIYDFKTFINGELISEYNINEEEYIDKYFIIKKKWYLREILFPGNSYTYSTVTYRVRNQYHVEETALIGYIFGTGRSWKDKIGKMTVYITHDDNIIINNINNIDTFEFSWVTNGKYKFENENIEPEIDDRIYINIQRFNNFLEYFPYIKNLLYKNENDIQYYTINQIKLFVNSFFINQEYELDEIDKKNIEYLFKLEKKIPRNSQENYVDFIPEVKILEIFNDNQEIEQEIYLENNTEEIYSELIINNLEDKTISVRIIIIVFGSIIFIICFLIFVIKCQKMKRK